MRVHLIRVHNFRARQPLNNSVLTNELAQYVCTVPTCKKLYECITDYTKHINLHFGNGDDVPCPFCGTVFHAASSYRSHKSRIHQDEILRASYTRTPQVSDFDVLCPEVPENDIPMFDGSDSLSCQETFLNSDSAQSLFKNNLASFY